MSESFCTVSCTKAAEDDDLYEPAASNRDSVFARESGSRGRADSMDVAASVNDLDR